mgnify:CR=1 FL=1
MKIDLIAGARPNFIKISPIIDAFDKKIKDNKKLKYRLIHTGQHYDKNMSESFFIQLGIPLPDINLEAGGGSHAEQTSKIMMAYEKIIQKDTPDYCLVVGDVNSTMACSIVAKKFNIKVMHVEGGIRSYDLSMPEEINRIVTDSISDFYYTTTEFANNNLAQNGASQDQIIFVGNTMVDSLLKHRSKFVKPSIWDELKLKKEKYMVMTMHRPSNVDNKKVLKNLISEIILNSNDNQIIFPAHPRTAKQLKTANIKYKNLHVVNPLGYLEFNYLVENSKAVITDSGGITEETTVMNIPCITLRDNTERPETISLGTNELVGTNPESIRHVMQKLFSGSWKNSQIPPLWDGRSAERILNHIITLI